MKAVLIAPFCLAVALASLALHEAPPNNFERNFDRLDEGESYDYAGERYL